MHELLLFAQVPATRHEQLLKIIAGVAGMQPRRLLERHLLFKPKRAPGSTSGLVGGSQGIANQQAQALQGQLQGELFYLQLVGEVEESQFPDAGDVKHPSAGGDTVMLDVSEERETSGEKQAGETNGVHAAQSYDFERQSWTLRFNDLPEVAGRRPVTSRAISGVEIVDGDGMGFMDAFGYDYLSEYVLEGHRLIYNNIVLLLHRVMLLPMSGTASSADSTSAGPSSGPARHLPNFQSLEALDPTGTYLLQASLRVQDGSKPEAMTLGINELKAFKDMMKGVVDLEVGDRLALDTRMR
ncbi:MAG: Mediator of RNA polymerase II transcription subunit 18 [Thelocarpon superellum]|nr:MAG: Mediator of RNA polymerase II transcription subunit 18 [Thelocarpon superellum]